ncbi:hypothetical protein BU15DRAFT_63434 [Melanogaster broomeanus]|nr:hypothetical protein BU15DRAFT_63434 [Melanogaster broomeanus]
MQFHRWFCLSVFHVLGTSLTFIPGGEWLVMLYKYGLDSRVGLLLCKVDAAASDKRNFRQLECYVDMSSYPAKVVMTTSIEVPPLDGCCPFGNYIACSWTDSATANPYDISSTLPRHFVGVMKLGSAYARVAHRPTIKLKYRNGNHIPRAETTTAGLMLPVPKDEDGNEVSFEPDWTSGIARYPLQFPCSFVPRIPGMDAHKLEELIIANG